MADLSKLVTDLSNLTVIESAELAKMLKEKWGAIETGQPSEVPAARKPTEGADIKLMQELIFSLPILCCSPSVRRKGRRGRPLISSS